LKWQEIPGWFQWRSGQDQAVSWFPDGSRFVEVGNYLGRSLCSLGEAASSSGKRFTIIGIDTCRGSGIEGPHQKDYHGDAVREGGGTFAGTLHRNVIACGYEDLISLIVSDSLSASSLFPDGSLDWVHLDARHDRESLKADIEAWLPKVKVNGWLSGDDYDADRWPDVVATVSELLPDARPWSTHQWRLAKAAATTHPPCERRPANQQTVVCILGMHRSGTSVVSRLVNLLGVDLGSDSYLTASGPDNPKGYWEHRAFVEINDRILAAFGGRWDRAPAFPCDWLRAPELSEPRERARQLLHDEFSSTPMWGWKDPRTSLTLPFWQELVGQMRYIIPVRNPAAVVASLVQRNGMSTDEAEALWLSHTHAILAATTGQPRLFVFLEDLMDRPPVLMQQIAGFLGVPERATDVAIQNEASGFIEQRLYHHRSTARQLASDTAVSFPTKSVYLALRTFVSGVDSHNGSPDVAGEHATAEQELNWIAMLALDAWKDARRHAASQAELEQAHARLHSALNDAAIERDAKARQAAEASSRLTEIYGSMAWRIIVENRRRLERILPQGTRRRRVFHAGLQHLTARRSRP